ncbi:MAG TPA: hypothetical protein VHQ24_08150 [Lachnospiraceae bacterium]|nr:hypothetical protein [Lachnospiraceae bacterium]
MDNFGAKVYEDDSNVMQEEYDVKDMYREDYDRIKNYYTALYGKDKYIKMALDKIEEEFKRAQKEESPIAAVTGGNARQYADAMRRVVLDKENGYGKLWNVCFVFLMLLTLTLLRTFREYDIYSLYEKLNHMYIGVIEIILLPITFLLMFCIRKLAGALFYRPTLIKVIIRPMRFIYFIIGICLSV